MIILLLSGLAKVFPDSIPALPAIRISCLKNEPASFVAAVRTDGGEVSVTPVDAGGCDIYAVLPVHAGLTAFDGHDDWFLNNADSGEYPDILIKDGSVSAKSGEWVSFYIEYNKDGSAEPGERTLSFAVRCGTETKGFSIKATVYGACLPPQKLIFTDWFHSDCLSTYYSVPVFSPDYYRITSNFMRMAADHGANMILTPVFTPPLDTEVGAERPTVQLVDVKKEGGGYSFGFDRLDKWITLAKDSGFKYFEISHLFTQWGAKAAPKVMALENGVEKRIFGWETDASGPEYTDFLRQFAPALKAFIRAHGLDDKVAFHTSDEPGTDDLDCYAAASGLITELFGDYKRIDAMSDFEFYKRGLIDTPVPSIGAVRNFAGKVPELWTYYCCSPCDGYMPNRLIAMPLLRVRSLGTIMYRYGVKGFLHWGYNFYYTQLSKRPVDPFRETDAGGSFPAGDAFAVYPSKNGEPLPSVRLKAFYDGLRDYELFYALEEKIGRDAVLGIIEQGLDAPIDERHFPRDENWFEDMRKRAMEKFASEC